MKYKLSDKVLRLWGVDSIAEENGVSVLWRAPASCKGLYFSELEEKLVIGAGVKLSFKTNSKRIALKLKFLNLVKYPMFDFFVNGVFRETIKIEDENTEVVFNKSNSDLELVEIWLSHVSQLGYEYIDFEDGANVAYDNRQQVKWITYGSSISQCMAASSPSKTWPAIVALKNHYDLTCLGVGGQCHLDFLMAKKIRDTESDLISICAGINIYGGSSLGSRTFESNLIGFIDLIRERRKKTPIALCSPVYGFHREADKNAVGLSLRAMRESVQSAVNRLRAFGDTNVHYVDGLSLLGEEHAEFFPDKWHPNTEGYALLAENFQREVVEKIFS